MSASALITIPLSHMCDTSVLLSATVLSPGDGTEVHCSWYKQTLSINRGDYNLSMTVTHAPVSTIYRRWPPVLTEVAKATTATCVFSICSTLFMVQTSKSCNVDIAIGSLYWLNYRYCCVHHYCVLSHNLSIVIESFAYLDATSCLCPTMFLFLATPLTVP